MRDYNVGPDDGDCVTTGELATLFVKRGARDDLENQYDGWALMRQIS